MNNDTDFFTIYMNELIKQVSATYYSLSNGKLETLTPEQELDYILLNRNLSDKDCLALVKEYE